MAKNNNPVFGNTPVIGVANLTSANLANDGSGTITSIVTGSAEGTRIDSITFINSQASNAASSAMTGKVFISVDSGVTWTLFDEIAIATVTRSASAVGSRNVLSYSDGILLKDTTHQIGVAISVYAGVEDRTSVIARGADLGA